MNGLKMNSADLVKGGVIVVILLASLAVFDSYGNHAASQITGAAAGTASSCPASITLSTGGFTNYNQGETVVFLIKVLDAKDNVLKTSADVKIETGDYGNEKVVSLKQASLAATVSGEMRYQLPLDTDFFKGTTKAKVWIKPLASSKKNDCGKVTSKSDYYVYALKTEPDLAVKDLSKASKAVKEGTYAATIANYGATVGSPFNVVARIKRQGSSTSVARTTLSSLETDKTYSFEFFIKPEDLSCGDNTLEVAVDPDGAVAADTNRDNNAKSITVKKDCTAVGSGSGGSRSSGTDTAPGGTGEQPAQQAANYKKTLQNGWNLVGLDVLSNVVSTTCGGFPPKISTVIYEFDPANQEGYVTHTLENDPANSIIKLTDSVDQTRVAWVYKYEQPAETCEIQSYIAPSGPAAQAAQAAPTPQRAYLDWNLVIVPQDWIGKTPSKAFTNACNFYSTAWYYDEGTQKYVEWAVSSTNTFLSENVGKAFWLYATSCYS